MAAVTARGFGIENIARAGECREGIGVQHRRPRVGVVLRGVTAGEDVVVIGRPEA